MKKAAELIEQIFDGIKEEQPEQTKYVSIFTEWEQIAGSDIASHTTVREIEGNTLIVEADHPGWTQLISLNNNRILRTIKKKFPELGLTRIRVIISG